MRPSTLATWFAASLLLCATALAGACGSGGSGGGSGGTGGSLPEPVECNELLGQLPDDGDRCATPGELCDVPGGTCYFACSDDLIWHEHCWTCPAVRPKAGDSCDPSVHTGDCMYPPESTCGPGSETVMLCDPATATWQDAAVVPCVVECDYWSDVCP